IAAERRPHLTNGVLGDPRVPEQAWAQREGLVAFAGYPLVVWNDIVGVMAMFSRRELSDDDFDALGSAATAVSVTISSVRHLEGEQRARRAAEEASMAKAEFLATMSHELRTPLNAIGGYTELLELGLRGPITDEQRVDLARIQQSQQHLLGLVNQVLDLAKDDAGALRVDSAAIRTGDGVDAALSLVRPQAALKSLVVTDACGDAADACYLGDESRVRQVLVNLLGNAVKFTPAGGRISVDCEFTESSPPQALLNDGVPYIGIRVNDSGVGIPADQVARIFEPFTQVERHVSPYARPAGGTGLGLAISRRLARLMGGDLTVHSRASKGSTFTLWLPLEERRATPRSPEDAGAARPGAEARRVVARTDPGATDVGPAERGAVAGPASPGNSGEAVDAGQRPEFARLGELLLERVIPLLRAWTARLRTDENFPDLGQLTEAELEDHAATLLTDVALALRTLDSDTDAPSAALRDGRAIMNVIGERHGAQRARLGWTETAVERELVILGEEVDATINRAEGAFSPATIEEARRVVARLFEQSVRVSTGSYRLDI
ncbi:MAG: hypothetical protein H0W68_14005, partial [Gemmatimonadaceae bacterium]|nr:hypothetical protein [Gemmatimonadaceae bacterium]